MTAVLSSKSAFRYDGMTSGSIDDNQLNYTSSNGSTDWKEKYYEVADMLSETRAELQDFQATSKDLEDELVKELERTEKTQQELKVKVARAEGERDEWKSKFVSLQTTHNTTTTSLQRELDLLRQDYQQLKIQMRELELGNDDLERNERAVASTLADVDAKYSRALEEKILLEHELLDKAGLEEECQRLKDELRDANLEVTVLKDKLHEAQSTKSTTESTSTSVSSTHLPPFAQSSENDILKTPPPAELLLSELTTIGHSSSSTSISSFSSANALEATPRQLRLASKYESKIEVPKASTLRSTRNLSPANNNPLARSSLPTWSPYNKPPSTHSRQHQAQGAQVPLASLAPLLGASESGPKSKAVQLVSDMRARIRNIDRMITGVPRLRVGSTTGRVAANSALLSSTATSKSNLEVSKPNVKKRSADLNLEKSKAPRENERGKQSSDTSGWVLIMEDVASKTPGKESSKPHRRSSNSSPSSYRSVTQSESGPTTMSQNNGNASNRSQSRLSVSTDGRNSISTTATVSSIPTPTSRPATPSFLPIPSSLNSVTKNIDGTSSLRKSFAPPVKRSSLGSTVTDTSPNSLSLPREIHYQRPVSAQSFTQKIDDYNTTLHNNVTVRSPRIPVAGGKSQSVLAQSRIGRPASFGTRKSTGSEDKREGRARAGSTAAIGGKVS